MDKLEKMLEFQMSLQKKIAAKEGSKDFDPATMTYEEKVNATKHFVLYCHEELSEVMASMKYKSYHKYDKEYSEDDIKVEIIDCLKFILNIGLVWGMDAETFSQVFVAKSIDNINRLTPHE